MKPIEILALSKLGIDEGQKLRLTKGQIVLVLVAPNSCEVGAIIGKEDWKKFKEYHDNLSVLQKHEGQDALLDATKKISKN